MKQSNFGLVVPRWRPPDQGWVKCNVDAAFLAERGNGASGGILRDDAGCFLEAQATPYALCMDALVAEACACRDGLIMAGRYGATRVHLETDCQEVINLWENRDRDRSVIFPILMEIQERSLQFQDFIFSFASRTCNKVAHELAKQATGTVEMVVWHESPSCILSLLEEDCNHVS